MNARVQRLREAGVSIWLDTLSRDLLETGEFEWLIRNLGISGATSNPTIFAKAIPSSKSYDQQLRDLAEAGITDPQALFFALGLQDIQRAADLLAPAYEKSGGTDGFMSFECTPDLADDTDGTVAQIAMVDFVFSLDSLITAVGMARQLCVMAAAIVLAVGVMLACAGRISDFIHRNPTLKMLALSFLILIGVMLVADGIEKHIERGSIYLAMLFALGVELLSTKILVLGGLAVAGFALAAGVVAFLLWGPRP